MPESTEYLVCKKCGVTIRVSKLKEYKRCPKCEEPDLRFWEFDSANWSSDYYPSKDEAG